MFDFYQGIGTLLVVGVMILALMGYSSIEEKRLINKEIHRLMKEVESEKAKRVEEENMARNFLLARSEWEHATEACEQLVKVRNNIERLEQFRRYGNAVAWLEWKDGFCEIKKLETLAPREGAASGLLEFLLQLADDHGMVIVGNPVPYTPTFPEALDQPLQQAPLHRWYEEKGFEVWSGKGTFHMRYPPRGETAGR